MPVGCNSGGWLKCQPSSREVTSLSLRRISPTPSLSFPSPPPNLVLSGVGPRVSVLPSSLPGAPPPLPGAPLRQGHESDSRQRCPAGVPGAAHHPGLPGVPLHRRGSRRGRCAGLPTPATRAPRCSPRAACRPRPRSLLRGRAGGGEQRLRGARGLPPGRRDAAGAAHLHQCCRGAGAWSFGLGVWVGGPVVRRHPPGS